MNGRTPEEPGRSDGAREPGPNHAAEGLDERRRRLSAELAGKRQADETGSDVARTGRAAGYADAFKLSSEFIGGVLVGGALGWLFDRLFGTSPWGLIVLLLIGFCAGVLNVLRSAGLASSGFGSGQREPRDGSENENGPEGPQG